MKRYNFVNYDDGATMEQHPDGEWVRWEDVERQLKSMRYEVDYKTNATLRSLLGEVVEDCSYHDDSYDLGTATCVFCGSMGRDFCGHTPDCLITRIKNLLEKP